MTLEELVAQRDALLRARATGINVLLYNSGAATRRVEYRTDAEMVSALADIEWRIAELQSGARPTTIRFATSKGLHQ